LRGRSTAGIFDTYVLNRVDCMPQPADRASTPIAAGAGGEDERLLDQLFPRVYGELKRLAHLVRTGRSGETLNTTALVHEAYLKLLPSRDVAWSNRAQFFGVAARAMRQVLVDAARRQNAAKRGATRIHVTYDDGAHVAPVPADDLLALDDALTRLASFDPRRARVVEHRIFAGLSIRETAALLDVSAGTVERDWRAARAWLTREVAGGAGAGTLPGERRPA
jgi:RNA polymerase sigma factor (TIGR02999 family)